MNNNTDTQQKVYVLLKDLPDLKAGQEYVECPQPAGTRYYMARDKFKHNMAVEGKIYTADTVENTPEWFQLKQQHTIEGDKRIEVSNLQYYGKFTADYKYIFQFCLNVDNIPSEKYEAVKQAIERVLNDEVDKSFSLAQAIQRVVENKYHVLHDFVYQDLIKNQKPLDSIPTLERQESKQDSKDCTPNKKYEAEVKMEINIREI